MTAALVRLIGQAPAPAPALGELWGLGVIAIAMIVGAYAVYRFGVLPERHRVEVERARAIEEGTARRETERARVEDLREMLPVFDRVVAVLDKLDRPGRARAAGPR